jgi:putative membrane protein insertion efficiency factor
MRWRVARFLVVVAIAAVIVHDVAAPVGRGYAASAALRAIDAYQHTVSPHLHGVVVCRFTPTCSHYGAGAIRKYGLLLGGLKTTWRLMRCTPLTKLGTYDPP